MSPRVPLTASRRHGPGGSSRYNKLRFDWPCPQEHRARDRACRVAQQEHDGRRLRSPPRTRAADRSARAPRGSRSAARSSRGAAPLGRRATGERSSRTAGTRRHRTAIRAVGAWPQGHHQHRSSSRLLWQRGIAHRPQASHRPAARRGCVRVAGARLWTVFAGEHRARTRRGCVEATLPAGHGAACDGTVDWVDLGRSSRRGWRARAGRFGHGGRDGGSVCSWAVRSCSA